jgi:hypothetical protein
MKKNEKEEIMLHRDFIGSIAQGALLLAALLMSIGGAQAFDESKYPDLKGQWDRTAPPRWLDGKTAPLTPEYRAIFEANLKDQEEGGPGTDPTYTCVAPGMPRVMNAYWPFEIVVTPKTTHLLMDHIHDSRRIFTDGREFPKDMEPNFGGYSIGKWIDTAGSGRYDLLEVETRGLRGPRTYDETGIPFHEDNETVINERIYLDKADRNILVDEITVFDHALTRPWAATKRYVRKPDKQPLWQEAVCAETNRHLMIADQPYVLSADGKLMPAKKDQAPPDLRYFKQPQK